MNRRNWIVIWSSLWLAGGIAGCQQSEPVSQPVSEAEPAKIETPSAVSQADSKTAAVATPETPAVTPEPAPETAQPIPWTSLFNGKDLTGWKSAPDAPFKVEEGLLTAMPGRRPQRLLTERDNFRDVHVRAECRIAAGFVGLKIRAPLEANPAAPVSGPRIMAGPDSAQGPTVNGAESATAGVVLPPNVWCELEVIVQGSRCTVVVNGKKLAESETPATAPQQGYIALVRGPATQVWFRKIEVQELTAATMPEVKSAVALPSPESSTSPRLPNEKQEGREAALAMIKRVGGTFAERGRVAGNSIIEVNISGPMLVKADLMALLGLVQLKTLYLSAPNIDDDALSIVGKLESLETLHLGGSHKITDEGLRHLAGLRNLTHLNLGYTGVETITGSGLVHLQPLTQLKILSLGTLRRLEGRYLKDIAPLSDLENLALPFCSQLGDEGLESLARLEKLQEIDLRGSNVTDSGLRRLVPTPKLKYVLLADTKTTEAGFAHLRKAGVAKYRVLGSAFLMAYYEPEQRLRDVVGLRYHAQVLENECNEPGRWKICFMHSALSKKGVPGFQQIDTNIFPNRSVYPHLSEAVPGKGLMKDGRRVRSVPKHGESSLAIGCQRGDGKSGCKSRSPEMFPTWDFELDYIPGNWARSQSSQRNLTGIPLTVEISRGPETRDVDGFQRGDGLPPDTYRLWTVTATIDGQPHAVDFAFRASTAEFFYPEFPTQISTEAFYDHPGLFKVVYWDLEVQRSNGVWEPIRRWKVNVSDGDPDENTWGFKRATFQGRPAIEVSNDGTRTYLKKGEILELD